ncbi:uncharacterized protein LOC136096700 [Hydra vulgaris]|uniref:uncharacterized protein LOC136096700 n=1 Tax=Hydra vulgaris TaxID=6087 RepID=UPI0032EA0815
MEQTLFILRYVYLNEENNLYEVQERFLEFVDCNQKTGKAIAELICSVIKKHNIPMIDCRGQGYDNGSNMSGQYKGAQAEIIKENQLAIYSPCACHSLNLCGVHAAECSRIESVKSFAEHIPGLRSAIQDLKKLNLTADSRSDIKSIEKYLGLFECIILASTWFKVLTSINYRNTVLQARDATLDVEVLNLKSLIDDLFLLRNNWDSILNKCKLVAENLGMVSNDIFPEKKRSRKARFSDEEQNNKLGNTSAEFCFKRDVFYVLLDCVIGNMNRRFEAAKYLEETFGVVWKYMALDKDLLREKASSICVKYSIDVSLDLIDELKHLKAIHTSNLGILQLLPFQLLNKLHELKLGSLFPNILVVLIIFCTLPVTKQNALSARLQELKISAPSSAAQAEIIWSVRQLARLDQELANRPAKRVNIDNYKSNWKTVSSGVPQGSVLGPLLFLIDINDLPDKIQHYFKMYADGCNIIGIIESNMR